MKNKRVMMIGLDGADPLIVKELVEAGRMPNTKKLLEEGCAHESLSMLGVFPTVTPPNWCSIATGNYPRTHGVTCFYNHTLGKDFQINQANWDSRRVESELIWETYSKQNRRSIMLNYCEAWPPRLENDEYGVYIDGTGVMPFMRSVADHQKIVTVETGDFKYFEKAHAIKKSSNDCVIQGDQFKKMMGDAKNDEKGFAPLVEFKSEVMTPGKNTRPNNESDIIKSPLEEPENWNAELPKGAKVATLIMNNGFVRRYAVIYPSDGMHYDTVSIYKNRNATEPMGTAKLKNWSEPIYDSYQRDDKTVKVAYIMYCLEMEADGSKAKFYISNAQDLDDAGYFYPKDVCHKLYENVGPMFSYAKFGTEYTREGQEILLQSFDMMHKWLADATEWLFEEYNDWELYYIHIHSVDFWAHRFIQYMLPGSFEDHEFMREMFLRLYESLDVFIGRMMKYLDGNTAIIVTSDHGEIPHHVGDENPGIGCLSGVTNAVMEQLGLTATYTDENGKLQIDWSKTTAVYQRSSYVYINVKGRDPYGIVEPEDYDKTVEDVISKLYAYRHPETGKRVIAFCMNKQEMESVGLGGPHCGDIFVQLQPTYCEEHAFTPSGTEFEGYSMHNLCILSGAGIKKGKYINRVIRAVDIAPTIAHLGNSRMPSNVEGGVIWQALEEFGEETY